ncbi:hypothetical protein EYF80_013140 [Liparis tanakae]|uniref:Uncharacterized protein n=1 Tax=Liparis tanakae TaxID=230148 RepID=A0A4Z2IFE2_9TELE|nr:hypothetical protein EYF80_013140 [Liparis tanakae]
MAKKAKMVKSVTEKAISRCDAIYQPLTHTLNSQDASMTTSSLLCSPRMGLPISEILRASSSSGSQHPTLPVPHLVCSLMNSSSPTACS